MPLEFRRHVPIGSCLLDSAQGILHINPTGFVAHKIASCLTVFLTVRYGPELPVGKQVISAISPTLSGGPDFLFRRYPKPYSASRYNRRFDVANGNLD
jgi:hypothetical protein